MALSRATMMLPRCVNVHGQPLPVAAAFAVTAASAATAGTAAPATTTATEQPHHLDSLIIVAFLRFELLQGRLGIHKGSKKFEGSASEMWDHHKTMKCVCDKGFFEIDCSKR